MAMKTWFKAVAAAAILAIAWPAISAFGEQRESDEEGIRAYSVARLRVFKGSAWVRTPDSGEWEEFPTNSPLPERARVSVPGDSEAEVQFHGGQGVLLAAGSEIDIRQLADERSAFGLRAGEIRFDLPETDFAPVRVRIPGGGSTLFAVPGRYWLTARDDGETQLVVRAGEATVSGDSGDVTVRTGEEAMIGKEVRVGRFGGGAGAEEVSPPLSEAETGAGVPPYAAYELRDYGDWVQSDEYGYVWRPRVAGGWSPYYYGQWDWVSPYGWVWISFEPWGWWPYHFGYWYSDPFFGWVWCPYRSFVSVNFTFGTFRTRHFLSRSGFAPATVRFVRDGRNVRWVPLRPGERVGRVAFTRSDTRLAGWDRPLRRGTVLVREGGPGSRVWRDFGTARGERRPIVREEGVGRRVPRGAADAGRGREMRPGGQPPPRRGGRPALEGRGGADRGTPPRRPEMAPRPERMDRDSRPAPRGRDSRVERRYDGGGRPVARPEARVGRDPRPTRYGSPPTRRPVERGRESREGRAPSRGIAPPAAGFERRVERAVPLNEGGRGADPGARYSLPRSFGGSEGRWDRGDRGDFPGFGSRGGGDGRGGRGGR